MTKEKTYHYSCWKYWWGYLLVLLMLGFGMYSYDSGYDAAGIALGIFGALMYILLEVLLRRARLTLTDKDVVLIRGIIAKHMQRIHYSSISEVGTQQGALQRILGFGGLHVDTPATTDKEIELKGFQSPSKIEKIIKEHVHRHIGGK